MHGISTLPGTNYVMWNHLIKKLGGWDEEALTEDSELSIRIYEAGYKIKFIPYAITYEQEPQKWGVWIRQRMRWVRGNNYVAKKFWKEIPHFKSKRLAFDLLYTLSLYYIFFVRCRFLGYSIYSQFVSSGSNFFAGSLYFCMGNIFNLVHL